MKQSIQEWIKTYLLIVILKFLELPPTVLSNENTLCTDGGGLPGLPGPVGRRGERGRPGPAETFSNWKQCVWRSANGGDSGTTIYTCSFTKELSDSALYVSYGANLRIYGCHGCCMRWYFTFDNQECSPTTIDGVVYMENTNNMDGLRHRTIQGYCHSLSSTGNIDVKVMVGTCPGYGSIDAYSGWNSVSRIIIREVPKSPYED